MKQSDGWSKPYAASFAINKSCLRQSNAFYISVSNIPPTPLLFWHMKKAMLSAMTLSESTLFKENLINDTHMERLVFHSIQYRNCWLAASDLFDIFTQSIKFYTFHYQYGFLKNVIHQIDSKNGWLLLSASFGYSFLGILTYLSSLLRIIIAMDSFRYAFSENSRFTVFQNWQCFLAQQSNFFWLYVKELHQDFVAYCIVTSILLFWS